MQNNGDEKEVMECLDQQLQETPDNADARVVRATLYLKQKKYGNALSDMNLAIKYYKKFVNTYKASSNFYDDSYYHLGMLYYKNDRLQDAKNAFYDLRGSDPNSPYNNSEKVKEILRK